MPRKYTYNDIVKYLEENTKLTLIDKEYIDCKTRMHLKCECGNEYIQSFDAIKNAKLASCPKCAKAKQTENRRIKEYNKFLDFVNKNSTSILLTPENEYIKNDQVLKFRCSCGNEFTTTANRFKTLNKRTCNKCSRSYMLLDYDDVKSYVESKGCELLSESYKGNNKKMKFRCGCGEEFTTTFANFKDKGKCRCDKCTKKQSTYSCKVEEYLKELNIKYEKEYKFDDCRFILPLPFDYYLSDYNILIEVDGEQHYEPSRFKDGQQQFAYTKLRDSIKDLYCIARNITLIRIPYYEINNNVYKDKINMLIPR